jgi:site-specific recombinase XerD
MQRTCSKRASRCAPSQAILGHKSLRTTELYMHVTQPGVERLQDVLDRLMVDL